MFNNNDVLADVKLLFNMQHVNYDDAYQEGYEQARRNITEAANPYLRHSKAYRYWREGWWEGFYNQDSLLNEAAYLTNYANDSSKPLTAYTQRTYKFLVLLFELMCVVFGGMLAYTAYDLSS